MWPSMVTHTRNLCSAFNPSKCTHTVVNIHPEQWAANAAAPGEQLGVRCLAQGSHLSRGIFFCYQQFFIFSHITQHNIQNITKQNNRHILNISRSNQKGGREGRTIKTQKSLLYTITYIHQKTLPSINGRGPGPTNSRRCTFT